MTENQGTPTTTRRKAKDSLLSDPRHVLGAARKAKHEGAGIARALELFRAYDPERYAEGKGYDSAWFTNRLVYYRQNKDWKAYVPSFGESIPKQLTVEALEELLAEERKANGGRLLLPPRTTPVVEAESPEVLGSAAPASPQAGANPAPQPVPAAEEPPAEEPKAAAKEPATRKGLSAVASATRHPAAPAKKGGRR